MDLSKYLGLLRWSLNYTDGTKETDVEAMDPETRRWLKEALESGVVDPVDQMKAIIKVLEVRRAGAAPTPDTGEAAAEDEPLPEDEFVQNKLRALEALKEWVESIDWAADLHKIGGFKVLIEQLEDPAEPIRARALQVVSTVVQNNPTCQGYAMELGLLEKLMALLAREEGLTEAEQAKALSATSSLVRDNTPALVQFIKQHKGVPMLLSVVRGGGLKGKRKALFFLRYLIHAVPAVRLGLAESLVGVLNDAARAEDMDVREHALHLLTAVYEDPLSSARVAASAREASIALARAGKGDELTGALAQRLEALALSAPAGAPAGAEGDAPKMLKDGAVTSSSSASAAPGE